MSSPFLKRLITAIIFLAIIGVFVWLALIYLKPKPVVVEKVVPAVAVETIGASVQGRKIEAYTFGTSTRNLLFVGGIHGGYEWNSVLLAYQAMDYLKTNPNVIPAGLSVTIIPNLNPDGVFQVTKKEGWFTVADIPASVPNGTGRFNAHGVDLNRNFDCKWQATSTWKTNIVSAGTAVFSEPEAVALRNLVLKNIPLAVIFWHSMSNAVYASACEQGVLPGTVSLMNTYAQAANYPAVKTFDSYVVTGAAEDWLASVNIPAITVELATHESIEWEKNLAGIKALFSFYR
jgi:predicted deacylase